MKNHQFKYNENCDDMAMDDGVFRIMFKPDVYDDFKKRDVTCQEIYDYVTAQTINAGKTGSFIKDTDKVKWTSGTNENNWLNKKQSAYLKDLRYYWSNRNLRLVVNGKAFSNSLKYNSYETAFYFGKGNTQDGI